MINDKEDYRFIDKGSNKTIKSIKALKMKKYRDKYGLFVLEGKRLVDEAIDSPLKIRLLIISETNLGQVDDYRQRAKDKEIQLLVVSDQVFSSISDTKTPQGYMAIAEKTTRDIYEQLRATSGFFLILDGIRDPGNLGTIIRTADAAGLEGVILVNKCADIYSPKVIRATMGSILRVPVYVDNEDLGFIRQLRAQGYQIVASHLNGDDLYSCEKAAKKLGLIIGSEDQGVSQDLLDLSDRLVKIPMPGGAESLNAAVAAGILVYEFYRKGL